ncbi:MAG: sulfite exporter TauE/SafE family protein [Deltaproteobacteria bacterium]|nr:sulfite exporter TauE/SafE family protein [Deltaproteobacteria bacterium]
METIDILSMFTLGLLAQGHCIGMCGPLIIAFPGRTGRFMPHLYYHFGRIATYGAVGAIMAAIGASLPQIAAVTSSDPQIWLTRGKIGFALIAGLFLFLFGISRIGLVSEPSWMAAATPGHIPGYRRIVQAAVQDGKATGMALMGLMMGLLPCGLSYGAFARALPAESVIKGMLLTGAFGLGTLPGLLLLGTGIGAIMRRYQRQSDILSGLLMLGMGLKLLFRSIKLIM